MIKLCTIDLDGTLFDSQKRISDENKKAILAAKEKGCKIVIASGRPIHGIVTVLEELQLFRQDDYVICYNGAKVFTTLDGNCIYDSVISGKDVKELYQEAKRLNVFIHAFRKNEQLITPQHNPYTDVEMKINHIDAVLYDFDAIKDDDEFLKCMLVAAEHDITRAMNELDQKFYDRYSVVRSSKIFLEFLNKTTHKGSALKALANYLDLDIQETMAIGDAGNDLEMIKTAGIGVAMENAFEEVKKVADFITTSNEQDGVANAIKRFIL